MQSRYTVTLEAALGADLTADSATWAWTDISTYVRGRFRLQRGRPDFRSPQAAECTFRLNNSDARFTPKFPTSPYYGQWGKGTPIRVKLNPGTGAVVRFQGNVAGLQMSWPTGRTGNAEIALTCKGALWRLGKGRVLRSPLYRAYALAATVPAAWWPLEESANATQASSGLMAGQGTNSNPMTRFGLIGFGATALTGAASLADLSKGGGLVAGPVPPNVTFSNGPGWTVEFAVQVNPIANGTNSATVLRIRTAGDASYWDVLLNNAANSGLQLAYVHGGALTAFASNIGLDDGETHNVKISTSTNVSLNVPVTVSIDGVAVISQTISGAGFTNGTVRGLEFNPLRGTDASYPAVGHLAVWYTGSVDSVSATAGYAGELATARVTRLAAEENVPTTVSGTSNVAMGPQRVARLVDLLNDCATADSAILADGISAGITYVSAAARYNLSATLALDGNQRHLKPAFVPIDDDSRLVDDVTASRTGGSSTRVTDEDVIASAGDYDGSDTFNVADDDQLESEASWLVHLGTVEEMRAPAFPINFVDLPSLVASWLALDLGERYTAVNPPSQYVPGGLDLVLEYYTEEFDHVTWAAELTGSPFAPWRAFKVADSSLGRVDGTASSLLSAATSGATSLTVVTTTDPVWTTAGGDAPFDIGLAGERVTVTAVASVLSDAFGRTSSSSWGNADTGQAYTTSGGSASDYSVGSGVGSMLLASVNVSRQVTVGSGWSDMEVLGTIRVPALATGASLTAGLQLRKPDTSNYYLADVVFGTDGSITLRFTKDVAGSFTTGFVSMVMPFTYAGAASYTVRAQAIGTTLRARIWPAAGTEPPATTWHLNTVDSSLAGPGGTGVRCIASTGNTNVSPTFTFDNLAVTNPQTFTVTRSVNTVVKAQTAGTAARLWKPAAIAL